MEPSSLAEQHRLYQAELEGVRRLHSRFGEILSMEDELEEADEVLAQSRKQLETAYLEGM